MSDSRVSGHFVDKVEFCGGNVSGGIQFGAVIGRESGVSSMVCSSRKKEKQSENSGPHVRLAHPMETAVEDE